MVSRGFLQMAMQMSERIRRLMATIVIVLAKVDLTTLDEKNGAFWVLVGEG